MCVCVWWRTGGKGIDKKQRCKHITYSRLDHHYIKSILHTTMDIDLVLVRLLSHHPWTFLYLFLSIIDIVCLFSLGLLSVSQHFARFPKGLYTFGHCAQTIWSRDHEVPTKPDFKFFSKSTSAISMSRCDTCPTPPNNDDSSAATGSDERRCVNTSQTCLPPLLRAQTNDEGEDRERTGRGGTQQPKRAQTMQNALFGP